MTDLLDATRTYWRKLNEVEAAYNRNELTVEEVDARVQTLIVELGQARRQALRDVWAIARSFVQHQQEALIGVTTIGVLAYIWFVVNGQWFS